MAAQGVRWTEDCVNNHKRSMENVARELKDIEAKENTGQLTPREALVRRVSAEGAQQRYVAHARKLDGLIKDLLVKRKDYKPEAVEKLQESEQRLQSMLSEWPVEEKDNKEKDTKEKDTKEKDTKEK